jgi:hypothetical protein
LPLPRASAFGFDEVVVEAVASDHRQNPTSLYQTEADFGGGVSRFGRGGAQASAGVETVDEETAMRVNVYAEEMTDRIEIISKEIEGQTFTGLRLYLELPVTLPDRQHISGPFNHRPGDDDSAAVTFWGKRDLRRVLRKALAMLDEHYANEGER